MIFMSVPKPRTYRILSLALCVYTWQVNQALHFPVVQYLPYWRASETLSGVYKFELMRYVYIYVWRYVCHNSSACHVYVMWAELGHSHFLYVPAVSNVVTNGNGTGTKNVLKGTVRFCLSLVSSLLSSRRYYCSENKTILYLDTVYHTFLLYCKRRNQHIETSVF